MAQYDTIKKSYAELAATEPSKQYVQYPEILRLLGEVTGKKILDVGCGPGLLTRQIAQRGAIVVAYDNSEEQIRIALDAEEQDALGIRYVTADADTIGQVLEKEIGNVDGYFDSAISTLVLHYAESLMHLNQFFDSTYGMLKDGGRFITIVCNPNYTNLGVAAYNRIFNRVDDGMTVDFLNADGTVKFSATYTDFSREDYENYAKRAGFKNVEWINLPITKEGLEKMGPEFWKGFEDDCPYVTFIATK